jgi:hypothetical protein
LISLWDVDVAGSNPVTPTTDFIEFFLDRPLTVPDTKGSRFQKRFQFHGHKITRNFGCPWMPTDVFVRPMRLFDPGT